MITVSGLWKSFGSRDLFAGADLRVGARDRIALVGLNGTGKTTLFEMLAGEQQADRGDITIARNVVIGFLRQETDALRGRPLLDEVLSVGSEVTEAGHRLAVLEDEIAQASEAERPELIAEYGRLQDRFTTLGGYSLEAEAKQILGGLGFRDADLQRPTESFSGGWLMRIALAKLLLASPDLLMLDEPTNHLDVESVEWLERFLKSYDGAVLLISHDRDFINGVATRVVEIWDRRLISYTGDYEAFVEQRRLMMEQSAAAAKNQARRQESLERFIERFRYKNTKAKQVQSKIKMLERMDTVDVQRRSARVMKLAFPQPPRPGRVVAELNDVRFGYGDVAVYEGLDLAIERDDKIALVGPNGAGKTTLLKLIAGVLVPQAGERKLGHKTQLGYFAQHQIEALDPGKRVVQELEGAIPAGVNVRPRDLLGRFLFSGDDVEKHVSVLSGGERTRLALAKLLVSPANLLCLDEPTNHLDIPSRDALEDALEEYAGALVLITHDRHLIRNVATKIVEVRAGRVAEFIGDYDYYLDKREEPDEHEPVSRTSASARRSRKDERRAGAESRARTKKLRDRVAAIERELDEITAENAKLEALLADPEFYASGDDVGDLVRDYNSNKRRIDLLELEWEEAGAALEAATASSG
ncbi:MAG: ABC-F family ATP-binding cassette domain-containing protein [Actinomycetota bacterium]